MQNGKNFAPTDVIALRMGKILGLQNHMEHSFKGLRGKITTEGFLHPQILML